MVKKIDILNLIIVITLCSFFYSASAEEPAEGVPGKALNNTSYEEDYHKMREKMGETRKDYYKKMGEIEKDYQEKLAEIQKERRQFEEAEIEKECAQFKEDEEKFSRCSEQQHWKDNKQYQQQFFNLEANRVRQHVELQRAMLKAEKEIQEVEKKRWKEYSKLHGLGITEKQPIAPGECIYKTHFSIEAEKSVAVEFAIYYKGIEGDNIVVESHFEGRNKIFKLPLDSQRQAFLNKADSDSTLLLTVVGKNQITAKETAYKDHLPIRFYPDLQQAFFAQTEDFKDNTGLVSAIEKEMGPFETPQNESEEEIMDKGREYLKQGNFDAAIVEFTKAIEINPNDSRAYYNRGLSYAGKGNYDQSISEFTKAIEINPNDSMAYNNRGLSYARKGNYDQAISEYNRAIEINLNFDGRVYFNRALAYYQKGDYNQSWEDVHKAESLGFNVNPNFLDDLKKASGREK